MTATGAAATVLNEQEYKRRIWAWTMDDWAHSAFATTLLAAVLPVYFSQVAGSTLPSAARATSVWSFGLSLSLLIVAVLSPILGTVSDVMRGKKRFLAIFAGIGILGTALLVLVGTGDWVLASILAIIGRIGFNGANSFYDALLPHVAREEDRDRVSARGYAMGYLGGGLLLAVNAAVIIALDGSTWGPRLSFLSVAVWWAVFTIPLLRHVPEPPAAVTHLSAGQSILSASFGRLRETVLDIRRYRELFKYLVAFLIYNDGIGTIIGVAAIYGAELGFGTVELILALLLVQFVGIPYSLIFGRLPSREDHRRPVWVAFVLFNLVALPLVGIGGARLLPSEISGGPAPRFEPSASAVGEGVYGVSDFTAGLSGPWETAAVPAGQTGTETDVWYGWTGAARASLDFAFNGQEVQATYSTGPDHGIWEVELDGSPLLDEASGEPATIDAYRSTPRYGETASFRAPDPGEHTLRLVNSGRKNDRSSGTVLGLAELAVLPGTRRSNLGLIIALIVVVELVGLALSFLFGRVLFSRLADSLDTRRTILLALAVYAVIAVWGFILNSVVEFWFLAWMVAVVQGGSQALSRSLYAGMSPAAKSGEFFGLFGIMEKFSAILGPLLFAAAGALFNSSRPAVLSLIVLFILGGYLLTRVNIEEGRRVAKEEDARELRLSNSK
jgi:UMF1 family MFS transporter